MHGQMHLSSSVYVFACLFILDLVYAITYDQFEQLPTTDYDFVIVGGMYMRAFLA